MVAHLVGGLVGGLVDQKVPQLDFELARLLVSPKVLLKALRTVVQKVGL